MKLTVYYDDQFWVGIVEEVVDLNLKAARFVFGSEPNDSEILSFVNQHMMSLLADSKPMSYEAKPIKNKVNPKRLARQAAREMQIQGISSPSHEALKADLESSKKERKVQTRLQREETAKRKHELATLKAKAKRRGR